MRRTLASCRGVALAALLLLLAPASTSAASSGALICDALNVCNFEVYNYR